MSDSKLISSLTNLVEDTITIADRFRGPPKSENGGYVAGLAASLLNTDSPVEVTLRSPIPLDSPLTVQRGSEYINIKQHFAGTAIFDRD